MEIKNIGIIGGGHHGQTASRRRLRCAGFGVTMTDISEAAVSAA